MKDHECATIASQIMGYKLAPINAMVTGSSKRWVIYKDKCLVGTCSRTKFHPAGKYDISWSTYDPSTNREQALQILEKLLQPKGSSLRMSGPKTTLIYDSKDFKALAYGKDLLQATCRLALKVAQKDKAVP